jgi:predicted transcriptional regulator
MSSRKTSRINIRCPDQLRRGLDDLAARMGEDLAAVTRQAVREFIERHGQTSEARP